MSPCPCFLRNLNCGPALNTQQLAVLCRLPVHGVFKSRDKQAFCQWLDLQNFFLEIGNVHIELINPSTKNETVIEHEPSQRTVLVPSICNCFYKLVWESTNKCGNLTWTQPYWTSYDANLTAYRTSNHKLATEISWWSTISILRDNRICHFCAQSQCSWKWDTVLECPLSLRPS